MEKKTESYEPWKLGNLGLESRKCVKCGKPVWEAGCWFCAECLVKFKKAGVVPRGFDLDLKGKVPADGEEKAFSSRCPVCDQKVEDCSGLCSSCWKGISFKAG